MSYPAGSSTPSDSRPATASAPNLADRLLVGATAALGAVNFLLGFLPFVEFDVSRFGKSTRNAFELSSTFAAPLGFLVLAGAAAGISLRFGRDLRGEAAASACAGFLTLLVLMVGPDFGGELAVGAYLLLVLAFCESATAMAAFLLGTGLVARSSPKPPSPIAYAQYQQPTYGPQGYGPPGGYGSPQGYGSPPGGYGSQQGYGPQIRPAGYGQPQYGSVPPGGYSGPAAEATRPFRPEDEKNT